MKKSNNTNNQSKKSLCFTDIPVIIFSVSVFARVIANYIPASVGDVLRPITLTIGASALLAQAILWIGAKIKNRKV